MNGIKAEIEQRGYWKVRILPTKERQDRFDLPQLRELAKLCIVRLRGWDYPHWNHKNTRNFGQYLESYCQFMDHREIWRFYKSGQFIHYFSMWEDWIDQERVQEMARWYTHEPTIDKDRRGLSILSTIYSLTEIYEFAARLASKDVLGPEARIRIELFNLRNRQLFFFDTGRYLNLGYVSQEEHVAFENVLKKEDLASLTSELALNKFVELAHVFQWKEPPTNVFREEQKKFLEKRL